jgi:hypothetical protein
MSTDLAAADLSLWISRERIDGDKQAGAFMFGHAGDELFTCLLPAIMCAFADRYDDFSPIV